MKDKAKEMKDDLQRKSDQKEKAKNQKARDEIQSLRTRIKQLESSDLTMQQDTIKQNKKNEKNASRSQNRRFRKSFKKRQFKNNWTTRRPRQKKKPGHTRGNYPRKLSRDSRTKRGKVEIERIHRSPPVFNPQLTTPRNVIAKFKNNQMKEQILQAAKKKPFRYHGNMVRLTQDLAASTLKDRKTWNTIFWKARELCLQPRIKYPSKLTILLQGKIWSFNTTDEFQVFINKRRDLNRKFDVQPQNSRESSKGAEVQMSSFQNGFKFSLDLDLHTVLGTFLSLVII
uniref:L1 transposable element RRM domain-containing protein n=1 Tax=Monodelphis domestica TaxID=13616 RepID=A0A5F8G784_MONDO